MDDVPEWPPKRIKRKRAKEYRLPCNAIYVGRPTKWGNPYAIGSAHWIGDVWITVRDNAHAVSLFRDEVKRRLKFPIERSAIAALRGHDLACWCPLDQPCHADALLELANAECVPWP